MGFQKVTAGTGKAETKYAIRKPDTLHRAQKISTNIDLLDMLLVTSDFVINSLRELSNKRTRKLPLEVLNLVVQPIKPPHQVDNKILCHYEDNLGSNS